MLLERSSGILLHPTSLPNGTLDEHAYRFVDWLAAAGQSWWQVLPLGPPEGITGSPYMSPSAFAGSPALLARPGARVTKKETRAFREANAYWIDDWDGSIEDQVRFEREWQALRAYARERGVRIFGDMPIYVSDDGADHRAHPKLFQTGAVAGVPPDAFTETGQLWGNPLYDWPAMRKDGYRWWIERFRRTFELVDLTRVDHFRGFVAYWAVPAGNPTAEHGRWRRGPGAAVFRAIEAELGPLNVVAEDLGVITEPVVRLRRELGFPGMVVLQFGIVESDEEQSVVYTGTHDNDTTVGWWSSLNQEAREHLGLDPADPAWSLIEIAWRSRSALAIAPLQDVLALGNEARMNLPGTERGNWEWRYKPRALTNANAARLRALTSSSRRARST
ncbi:MAG TPA: 4-alpha-glucanotransferase [Gaiellaceae bacterium]|jgi:4-alpha-glucanotransferase|nr:4-alpha-glucanotransferase [Gaiellaceae bacterium]